MFILYNNLFVLWSLLNFLLNISGLLRYKVDFQSMQCDVLDPNELYDMEDY